MLGFAQRLFQDVVWSELEKMGWKVEFGKRQDGNRSDRYYCLPGTHFGRPFRKNIDFFNSTAKVLEFIRTDPEWSKNDRAGRLAKLFDACLDVKAELADKGVLPKGNSLDVLRSMAAKRLDDSDDTGIVLERKRNSAMQPSKSEADVPLENVPKQTSNSAHPPKETNGAKAVSSKVEYLEIADNSLFNPLQGSAEGNLAKTHTSENSVEQHQQQMITSTTLTSDDPIQVQPFPREKIKKCPTAKKVAKKKCPGKKKKTLAPTPRSFGGPRHENILFHRVVWPKLESLGWHIQHGVRKTDKYFCLPGKHRGKPFVNRVDYFDSARQVMNLLESNREWSERAEVIELFSDLRLCRKTASRIDAEGRLPADWTAEWLLQEGMKGENGILDVNAGEVLQTPTRDDDKTNDPMERTTG